MHIHPRYNEDLREIPGEWGWVQNDSVGNLLEILSDARDAKRARFIVRYLDTIEYWQCPDFGFWEEGPKQVRSSSLAACIRGLESYRQVESNRAIRNLIERGYESLYELLPNETKTRKHDLALLSLIYPKQLVPNDIKEKIVTNVQSLEGRWGVERYFGDSYDGIGRSSDPHYKRQWLLGLRWLYIITEKLDYFLRAREVEETFGPVEGIVNGRPTGTLCLLWEKAMEQIAYEKFKIKN